MSQTIATAAGREKLAKARAGVIPLPKCAFIALGDGGELQAPSDTAEGLFNEVIRKEITQVTFPSPATAAYTIKLSVTECAGVIFDEIGLFDEDGTLIAIKTFGGKQKDSDMEMSFEIDDVF